MVEDADGDYAGNVMTPGGKTASSTWPTCVSLWRSFPTTSARRLVLVGASGFFLPGGRGEICRVPVGTVKSRVNRARNKLATLLGNDPAFTGAFGERLAKTAPRKARLRDSSKQIGVWPCLTITGALAMSLGTILLIILILILIGALPSWGYSRSWGTVPSGLLGLVLVVVIVLMFAGTH